MTSEEGRREGKAKKRLLPHGSGIIRKTLKREKKGHLVDFSVIAIVKKVFLMFFTNMLSVLARDWRLGEEIPISLYLTKSLIYCPFWQGKKLYSSTIEYFVAYCVQYYSSRIEKYYKHCRFIM